MRVLLVESDSVLAGDIRRAFEADGHGIAISSRSLAAWDMLVSDDPPDLLITRMHFGGGHVPGTALGWRAQSEGIPVIYIPLNAELAAHADAGHGAVLMKPFAAAELVETAKALPGARPQTAAWP
jgi:DNA-binding response OmpR family regulator